METVKGGAVPRALLCGVTSKTFILKKSFHLSEHNTARTLLFKLFTVLATPTELQLFFPSSTNSP